MTRDEVADAVKKNISDALDDIEPSQIDTSKRMTDVGANSLDIVEIVSRTMRQLKVKIPRSELSKLKNIDDLIDLLHQNASR